MPSANPQSPQNPSTPPQSIPLRDLTRPPDTTGANDGERRHTRGRSLLSGGPRSSEHTGPRYERLAESSPSPPERAPYRAEQPPYLNTRAQTTSNDHGGAGSPIENLADFQAAMGFAGLSVPDINVSPAPVPAHAHSYSFDSFAYGGHTPYMDGSEESTFFASDSDRLPLTDPNSLQPISGSQRSAPHSSRHNRSSSFQSISFDTPESARRTSRLGDELRDPELGASPKGGRSRAHSYGMSLSPDARTRSRSPSTSGAFSRAGSIVRAMSQRVVNLSGEAEMIEQSARREAARASRRTSAVSALSVPEERRSISSLSDEAEECYQPKHKADPLAAGPTHQADLPTAPVEKAIRFLGGKDPERTWQEEQAEPPNPFRGKSLGLFPPDSTIRNKLCDLLVYPLTEPLILLLIVVQTVLLAVDGSKSVYDFKRSSKWGESPIDYALLGLFVIFTLELVARIIVSGFVMNAPEYSTRKDKQNLREAMIEKYHTVFKPQRHGSVKEHRPQSFSAPDMIRSFTAKQSEAIRTVEQAQRLQLARRAFLRHGFNRLDFLAVIAFWITFFLSWTQIEHDRHLYIFRMLSCLRILRLLALTHGTAIILRSLKKATPMLLNVSFLIGFFWLIFAIIGVQSFKSSLDRQCVWLDPSDLTNSSGTAYTNVLQFCGGQLNNETGALEPWKVGTLDNLRFGSDSHKGYMCPRGSVCLELQPYQLPYNGTVSFDNIFQSLELVFVVMSGNTWSALMYYTTDSDYLAAALFFAGGIMIMLLWLINLLIAVITSSFQVIREEGKASAFAAQVKAFLPSETGDGSRRINFMRRLYDRTYWFWIVVISYGFICQGFRSSTIDESHARFIDNSELLVTLILLVEIIVRFAVDWRNFVRNKQSWVDLGLAVVTSIILLPPIRNSGQPYAWLTVFQLLRIYRVIIAIPVTRGLITLVLGNSGGIVNLIIFVFLITFLMSILAVQMFRGELTPENPYGETLNVTFFTIWNAFLGMYQILSSEGWTDSMYNLTAYNTARNTAWMAAVFFIGWFILANFILVNMFIAVIQENFDVSEDEKRMHQVKAFLNRKELGSTSSNLSLSAVFRFGRTKAAKDPLDYGPATMEMLLKDAVVKDFLDDENTSSQPMPSRAKTLPVGELAVTPGFLSKIWGKIKSKTWNREPNPFYTNVRLNRQVDETTDAQTMAKEAVSATAQRKKAQREYLAKHPNYNTALYIFKPSNPVRRFCQKIVGPGRGSERFDGVEPTRVVWYAFSAFIYMAIVAMVLLACVTTPLYQKEYFEQHGFHVRNWFVWADMAFAAVFTIEALIKVIADGLFWTPNAYFRSSWGFIDAIVLITFWINVLTALSNDGAVSRAVGAFKALRALRLLNVSDSARDTFHSLIIIGGWKILSAMFVSLSLLLPFATYGVNLFNGKMTSCNDGSNSITTLAECFGEYNSNPASNQWDMLAPRVVSNPYYSFDDFGSSLFILFQIVSQEGWTDVMWSSISITGRGLQPQHNASQGNAVFFVIFNLLSTVFILTLFISVFMRNYTEQTGVAFLTADQRSWLELRKLLKQVSPSKRPSATDGKKFKDWCYKRAVRKHGRWQRSVTLVLVLHLILLLIEYYPEPLWWNRARDITFLAFTLFYISNIFIRLYGLSWARFRRSSWDLYSVFSVFGAFATSVLLLSDFNSQVYIQLHKLFLVAIVLLLIPRNDALDQLFKTAAASLTNIGNLLATWFVLFLVYAIALTQAFGLTRFGEGENSNYNFRTVPKALIVLLSMSFGEGWNETMEDFAQIKPPLCVYGTTFFDSDCGSTNWARGLFITWNILSMYIFTSLFVSLIYESFSYVYQNSSGLGKVSREEIRRFKQAWAVLDPDGTGFISKEQFPRLLGELSGVFEMRIYKHEDSVRNILEDIQTQGQNARVTSMISLPGPSSSVDLKALNKRLAQIDPREVRRSRARYNMFCEEVMVSADVDRGISFNSVLMILAHYNIISDNKSLRLEEFLRRRARLQRVEEEVRRRVVLGFFDTMYWSRRFKKHQETKRAGYMTDIPQLGPEVFIDDMESRPQKPGPSATLLSPLDVPPQSPFLSHGIDGARRSRSDSLGGGSPGPSPRLSPHRPTNSAYSFDGTELIEPPGSGNSSRRNSSVSAENVLDVLDNSAWGESIRRSFTTKRPENRGSS